jgi:hypothetical protein
MPVAMRKTQVLKNTERLKVFTSIAVSGILLTLNILNPAYAEEKIGTIGVVEIEGQEFRQEYFEYFVSEKYFDEKHICPPVSDALVRDQLINSVLRSLELKKTDSASEETRAALKALTEQFEGNSNPSPEVRVAYEVNSVMRAARDLEPKIPWEFETSLVVDHYRDLVAQGSPLLVDVVLIKRRELDLWNHREVETATEMVEAGNSIGEIATAIDRSDDREYQADEWHALHSLGYKLGEPSDLQPDTMIGPIEGRYDPVVVYLEDIKTVSRLRPSARVNSDWTYALSVAKDDLRKQMQYGIKDSKLTELWNKYTVLLDGKRLQRPDRYPDCLY